MMDTSLQLISKRSTHGVSGNRVGCAVIVPVKRRALCKSRLASCLSPRARIDLARSMLANVLSCASSARSVGKIFVVSPDRDSIPDEVTVLTDAGTGLNRALRQAQRALLAQCHTEFLVLPADLPCLMPDEIDQMVAIGRQNGFAIAPDAAGTGTNALYIRTDREFRFRFGASSRHRHFCEARAAGMSAQIVNLPGLEFDVDLPADLNRLYEQRHGSVCLA